jgi:trimeric autotransporter adhesin
LAVKLRVWQQWMGGLSAIALVGFVSERAISQTASANASVRTQAADLAQADEPAVSITTNLPIPARASVGYSSSGGGYDGFGSFEGFIPLQQTPGQDLFYLIGRLLLDNDANLGSNLLLGYRVYNPGTNRIHGAYLGYDTRDTGNNLFSQLGLGFETLGNGWDARLNAYIPVGDVRQIGSERIFDTGTQLNSFRFEDHFLRASGLRQRQVIRDFEVAVAGFDLEAGGRVLPFGNGGDLRGYGGLYYLSADDSSVGVRGRLEARPLDGLTLGLTVQHDGILGTNVFGTIALAFPNSHFKGANPKSVQARLGEMPYRINAIAIDRQREVELTSSPFIDTILTNPATGQPYFFQHVTLGANGGNGTIETPFGLVQPALNATRSDGNDIVYVQAGTNSGIPAFTIRDRVQVLSTGPVQLVPATISGQFFPSYQLPLSGSGVFPSVTGTVTMGNDTVLSGFSITSATGAGVTFNNVSRVQVRDNFIPNTAGNGILGNGVGDATLLRNQITSARNQGVFLQNVGTTTISDNTVTNTIAGPTTIANPITGDITIGSVTIPNPGSIIPLPSGQGIVVSSVTGPANIQRNTVSGTGTQGIVLLNATGPAAVTNNTVSNTVGNDFTVTVPALGNLAVPTGQGIVVAGANNTLDVSRNTVSNVRGQGVTVAAASGTTTVSNNTIQNTVDQGMVITGTSGTPTIANNQISDVVTRNVAIANPTATGPAILIFPTGQGLLLLNANGTVNVTGNTVERIAGALSPTPPALDSGQGIALANFSGQLDLILANNQVRNNFNDGILLGLAGRTGGTTTPSTSTITITGNTLENNGGAAPVRGDGIAIGLEQDAIVNNVLIENNAIRSNGDEGIDIRLGQLAVPILNPVTARLTGTIRGNTITGNGQNGVQVGVRGGSQANLAIRSNTITGNGLRGIDLSTASLVGLGTPQLSANIQQNTLTGNTATSFGAQTTASPGSSQFMCLNVSGNTVNSILFVNAVNVPANTLSLTGANLFGVFTSNTFTAAGFLQFTGVQSPVTVCP